MSIAQYGFPESNETMHVVNLQQRDIRVHSFNPEFD